MVFSFKSHHSGMETRGMSREVPMTLHLNRTIVGWKHGKPRFSLDSWRPVAIAVEVGPWQPLVPRPYSRPPGRTMVDSSNATAARCGLKLPKLSAFRPSKRRAEQGEEAAEGYVKRFEEVECS